MRSATLLTLLTLVTLLAGCASSTGEVEYRTTDRHFQRQDAIEIHSLTGDSLELAPGHRYTITGEYRLDSRDSGTLALYCANGEVRVFGERHLPIQRGEGHYSFEFEIVRPGMLHFSIYPAGGGSSFASLYFEQEQASR